MHKPSHPNAAAPQTDLPQAAASPALHFRSGAVARMVHMPVATLRIWQSRHAVAEPATTAAGHRLYSAADVQRLSLLKRLTDQGHAIGSLARLSMSQLLQVLQTQNAAAPLTSAMPSAASAAAAMPAIDAQVLGPVLWQRLLQAEVRLPLQARLMAWLGRGPRLQRLDEASADGPALNLPHGQRALQGAATQRRRLRDPVTEAATGCSLLLVHRPSLQLPQVAPLLALARRCGTRRLVVLAAYVSAPARQALQAAQARVWRDSMDDAELVQAVAQGLFDEGLALATTVGLRRQPGRSGPAAEFAKSALPALPTLPQLPASTKPVHMGQSDGAAQLLPRRFDDAVLAEMARLSSTMACECPQHVAALLMQLSNFEAYSAQCLLQSQQQQAGDAALHAYLQQVAGHARALFEDALERVALHEGLVLKKAC